MIIYRHYEILKALDEQPNLKTDKLLKACRDKPGSELPEGGDVISKIVYSLRQSGYLTSSDVTNGKVHKITQKGIEAINEYEQVSAGIPNVPEKIKQNEKTAEVVSFYLDSGCPIENALIDLVNIVKAIKFNQEPPPEIEDKDKKIDALIRLSNIMSDDIRRIFEDIAADLERVQ